MNIFENLENLNVSEECFDDIANLIECYLSEDAEDERRRKMRAAKMKEMREAAKKEMKQNGGSYLENIKKIADRRNYMNTGAGKQELQHIESEGNKQENKELTKELKKRAKEIKKENNINSLENMFNDNSATKQAEQDQFNAQLNQGLKRKEDK